MLIRLYISIFSLILAVSSAIFTVSAAQPTLYGTQLKQNVEQRKLARLGQRLTPMIIPVDKRPKTNPVKNIMDHVESRLEKSIVLQERAKMRRERRKKVDNMKIQLIDAINLERSNIGSPPVTNNVILEIMAQEHASDMLERGYFNNTTPEGKTSMERANQYGYTAEYSMECKCEVSNHVGQNIAKGQTDVHWVIDDWMNSSTSREILLSPDYDEIGVGIAGDVWVTNFGSVKLEPVTGNRNQSSGIRMESEVDRLQ